MRRVRVEGFVPRIGLVVCAVLLLSGCFGRGPAGPAPTDTLPPLPPLPFLESDHDHRDASLHQEAVGVSQFGFIDAKPLLGQEPARFSDLHFHGNRTVVTVNGRGGTSSGGFFLFDMAGPADWTVLQRYRSGSDDNWYARFNADGRFVFLTANANGAPNSLAGSAQENVRSTALAGGTRGIHIVNVTDGQLTQFEKTVPDGYYPSPIRVISFVPWIYPNGEQWLFASMVYDPVGAAPSSRLNYVSLLRFESTPGPPRLTEMQRWQPAEAATIANAFPHDLTVGIHPFNGRPLLFVAYWDAGGYILDIRDPRNPTQVARIPPSGPDDHVHTFKPHHFLIDDQYYAVMAPETFANEPAGPYRLFNLTDTRNPSLVATWFPPPVELRNSEPLLFSPHEFSLAHERLYAAQFHGGLWVVDIPSFVAKAAWVKSVGNPERTNDWAVNIAKAVWYRDYVYGVDMGTGIVVLRETV